MSNHNEKEIGYSDQEFIEISIMFYSDNEDPTFGIEHLKPELLDYSIDSLEHINDYLLTIKGMPGITKTWNKVILRCGAYIGEVIRRNSKKNTYNWYDYENAKKIGNEKFNQLGFQIGTSAVLYRWDNFFCFPLAKVEKFLESGLEHNIKTFAKEILAKE